MVDELAAFGFERFIAEPMMIHDKHEEKYLSIERQRNGFKLLYSPNGGVDIEEHSDDVEEFNLSDNMPLPQVFIRQLTDIMNREHMSFLEINPLVVRDSSYILLDAAVLVDSAGGWRASWRDDDIVDAVKKSDTEKRISALNDGSPASFSFRVLNPDAPIWLLLSGGGASITIADEAANRNKAHLIGNYGEYSGGPTREETQLYTEAVMRQMTLSHATKKAIVIAGGVANFTDVKKTLSGVIDALNSHIETMQMAGVKVFVRRGGPNEKEGLKLMESFLKEHGILGSVHGSDKILTTVIDEALEYIDA